MEVATTLVSVETKSGQNQNGDWRFEIYTDATGRKFKTGFNSPSLAQFLNQPVMVVYTEQVRPRRDGNGTFTDNVIESVSPATNTQPTLESQNGSQAVSAAPVASQDDLAGRVRTHIAGHLAHACFNSLPENEQNVVNAKRIGHEFAQWAIGDEIPF